MTSARVRLQEIARRAMGERGLNYDFDPKVLAEADASRFPGTNDRSIRDLRGRLWCSIDNDDTRDLDQLTVAEPLGSDGAKLLIAVADVDALAPKGSAVDRHAAKNTTSVYTAAQVFPMLPERLSTELTSLVEGEDRLAVVVEMAVAPDGSVGDSAIYRAVVRNRAKLTYRGVAAWLDGEAPAPRKLAEEPGLEDQLRMQDRIAQSMKALRHRHGALALETREPRPTFNGDMLADVLPDDKDRAKDMIEDFMIAANGVTARYLDRMGLPSMRRVLRAPARWERIVAIAAEVGEELPRQPDARALQGFLVRRKRADPNGFPDLSLAVVKNLGNGEYALEAPGRPTEGHFGLAARDYAHSTAPNRRFPDLVTQRLLKAAIAGAPPAYTAQEIEGLARHCTEQEDDASKIERQVRKSAAALLLEQRNGERFEGIVTGAAPKGTWVRIRKPSAEGRVSRGERGLDVGDRIRVELLGTDVERGFIDFGRV